jgi:hypothetical protein
MSQTDLAELEMEFASQNLKPSSTQWQKKKTGPDRRTGLRQEAGDLPALTKKHEQEGA